MAALLPPFGIASPLCMHVVGALAPVQRMGVFRFVEKAGGRVLSIPIELIGAGGVVQRYVPPEDKLSMEVEGAQEEEEEEEDVSASN